MNGQRGLELAITLYEVQSRGAAEASATDLRLAHDDPVAPEWLDGPCMGDQSPISVMSPGRPGRASVAMAGYIGGSHVLVADWLDVWDHPDDAREFERATLLDDDLPECAVHVRDGGEPTAAYWGWLMSRVNRQL